MVPEPEALEELSPEELAAERSRLVTRAQELMLEMGQLGKADPRRAALVDEKMTLDRQLSRLKRRIKARNNERAARRPYERPPEMSPPPFSDLEPIDRRDLFAAAALIGILGQPAALPPDELAKHAWMLADAMLADEFDDSEPAE